MTEETFTAYDIRGKITEGMSLDVAWNIGKALADWLSTYGSVTLIRGEGSNETLVMALIEGLRLQGRHVVDGGSGSKTTLMERITADGLSGGVYVAHDIEQDVSIIELYDDKALPIVAENGLSEIAELSQAGNFVPAAVKGELSVIV